MKNPALGALLALEADVFKVAGIPESVEVALNGGSVVDVARLGEDAGPDRVGGDAAIAMNVDADDKILLADDGSGEKQNPATKREDDSNRCSAAKLLSRKKMEVRDSLCLGLRCGRVAGADTEIA